jgi:hypothetical protein
VTVIAARKEEPSKQNLRAVGWRLAAERNPKPAA